MLKTSFRTQAWQCRDCLALPSVDPKKTQQDNLWDSWIELGEDFYEAVTAASVPVDLRALRALKRSPLALDLKEKL